MPRRKKREPRASKKEPKGPIYGATTVDWKLLKSPLSDLASTPEGWRSVFHQALGRCAQLISSRDPWAIVARACSQAMVGADARRREAAAGNVANTINDQVTEFSEVEMLQALALGIDRPLSKTPCAPSKLEALLSEISIAFFAFSRMQRPQFPTDPEKEQVVRKLRLHTMYRRNNFTRDDCERVTREILQRFDKAVGGPTESSFAAMFDVLFSISRRIEDRLGAFYSHIRGTLNATTRDEILGTIKAFCSMSPAAAAAWRICQRRCVSIDDLRTAALQLSEISHSWIFTFDKQQLSQEFGPLALVFLDKISIRPGELAAANVEHFMMNNPIWTRPLIALDDQRLMLAVPGLPYSFPFRIFEAMIAGNAHLEAIYSRCRAEFLEEEISRLISTALPSARVYRQVFWRDDESNILYENDVVAIVGNTILLFEGKSGKLDPVAQRGGVSSFIDNSRALFVEPAKQAARLESYLNRKREGALLWLKTTESQISLDLDKPKVVHKFSVCIEHFAALTSARHNLKILGAIKDEQAWAPVLSLGELLMVWQYLDTEVSFYHYLTRRATLEEHIDFEGDEMDILSMYLINGLCIDPQKLEGRRLSFLEFDHLVRSGKVPRLDRTEFEVYGVPLTAYWHGVLKEVYSDRSNRHRFDVIQVVLNQDPFSLKGIGEIGRKWRQGGSGRRDGDILFLRFTIAGRVFVLGYYLLKRPITGGEWGEQSRTIARNAAIGVFAASDFALFMRLKKSKEWTFDAMSFHRFLGVSRQSDDVPTS
jgi:hypothetical protein